MAATALDDWLSRLEKLHPAPMALGLDRVDEVYQRLAPDLHHSTVITVAGTNGKGSVIALLQSMLLAAGRSVASYTSPHLLRYNERVVVNGVAASDEALVASFEAVERCRHDTPLTYFEFGTLAALHHFSQHQPDYLLLEVGLGGRLDAVNIVDPAIAVITSIALDHEAWLGDTREAIGSEKAGIFRRGVPAVCGDSAPPASVIDAAERLACPLTLSGRDFYLDIDDSGLHWHGLNAAGENVTVDTQVVTQLLPVNIATALQVYHLLDLPAPDHWDCLAVTVPGRMEVLDYEGVEVILDVAHNPAAAGELHDALARRPRVERCVALTAVMSDKDISGMVGLLKDSFDAWFVGDFKDNPRALPARELAARIHEQGIHMISVSKNLRQAFARAISLLETGHRLVVFGSVYTVAEVRKVIDRKLSRQALERET